MKRIGVWRIVANHPAVLLAGIGTYSLGKLASHIISAGNCDQLDDPRLANADIANDGGKILIEVRGVWGSRGDVNSLASTSG